MAYTYHIRPSLCEAGVPHIAYTLSQYAGIVTIRTMKNTTAMLIPLTRNGLDVLGYPSASRNHLKNPRSNISDGVGCNFSFVKF